jgi:hypothetical protein
VYCQLDISIIVDERGPKIVQFSHFSVKEFLTSDRLQTPDVGNISQHYIALEPAHTLLARACLTVLLQSDEYVDEDKLTTCLLALCAAQHWVDHPKFAMWHHEFKMWHREFKMPWNVFLPR